MAKITRKVKQLRPYFEPHLAMAKKIFGDKADKFYDDAHPVGTMLEEQQQMQDDLKAQLDNPPPPPKVMPIPDDAELRAARRREAARRRRGRASTILGGDSQTLG